MKLEKGMYVRNNHFGIGKINKEYFDSNNKHWFNVQFNCYKDEDCHCGICEETMGFKASHNIIDLVEVGDFVNKHLVHEIEEHSDGYDKELHLESSEVGSYRIDRYNAKDKIKSILTHELYEANCYKVVE